MAGLAVYKIISVSSFRSRVLSQHYVNSSVHKGQDFVCTKPNSLSVSTLRLKLFGPIEVWVDDTPLSRLRTRKGYLLLALLALRAGSPVSRDWLIGTLWPESDQEAGAMSLRRALHDLRAALGEAETAITAPDKRHLSLETGQVTVDVWELSRAHQHWERTGALPQEAHEALARYTGPLLSEYDDEVLMGERHRYQQQAQSLGLALLSHSLQKSETERALLLARQLEALDPLHEPTQQFLYQALIDSGDPAGARLAFRAFRLRLHTELRQDPSRELRRSLEQLTEVAPRPRAPAVSSLPLFHSHFIGREREREALARRLFQGRLTTLLGPGGVGKTRLAIETIRACQEHFPGGVFFADLTSLAPAASLQELWQVVAQAVGAEVMEDSTPEQSALGCLQLPDSLLILDNTEHLVATAAFLTTRLLSAAPELRLLTTSRAPLNLPGEQLHPLPPLSLAADTQWESVQRAEAVQLFLQRAQALHPAFTLTAENATPIAELCRCLDGLPLALELAAVRLRHLSLTDLLRRLQNPLHTLTHGPSPSERQQSLESLIAWSYDLLSPEARTLLCQLSHFPDAFLLEAAEGVGKSSETLETLAQLIDSSLVQTSEDSLGYTRYRLLETIRVFARHRCTRAASDDALQRLASWGVSFVERAYEGLWGAEGSLWLRRIGLELPNLQAALEAGDATTALPIARHLEQFWWRTNRFQEGAGWFSAALARSGGSEELRLSVHLAREQFFHFLGEPSQVLEAFEEAIQYFHNKNQATTVLYLHHSLAILLAKQQVFDAAEQHLHQALEIAQTLETDSRFYGAYVLLGLLEVLTMAGRLTEAEGFGQEALKHFTALGRVSHSVQAQRLLGQVALQQGRLVDAEELLRESLLAAQENQLHDHLQEIEASLGELCLQDQRPREARAWFESILDASASGGLKGPVERAHIGLKALG